jgi:hypothetical protein
MILLRAVEYGQWDAYSFLLASLEAVEGNPMLIGAELGVEASAGAGPSLKQIAQVCRDGLHYGRQAAHSRPDGSLWGPSTNPVESPKAGPFCCYDYVPDVFDISDNRAATPLGVAPDVVAEYVEQAKGPQP